VKTAPGGESFNRKPLAEASGVTRAITIRLFAQSGTRSTTSIVMDRVIPPAPAGGFWWGVRATEVSRFTRGRWWDVIANDLPPLNVAI
jgi:hypothetical protein